MKIRILTFASLIVIIVLSLGVIYSVYFKTPSHGATKTFSQDTSSETVISFCSLMEKSDKNEMENYVTTFPNIYRKQIYARRDKYIAEHGLQDKTPESPEKKDANIMKEAPPKNSDDIPQIQYKNKAELLAAVSPEYLFTQKRFLKEIVRVWEKDNQARIEVVLGSREEGWFDIPTSFWLYKEDDGKWRIFLMQNMVMNEEYAR